MRNDQTRLTEKEGKEEVKAFKQKRDCLITLNGSCVYANGPM